MRWKVKHFPRPWETREKTSFLFWPMEIDSEVRWLEKATYVQRWWPAYGWLAEEWIDE